MRRLTRFSAAAWLISSAALIAFPAVSAGTDDDADDRFSTGSGEQYQTTIERQTIGELTPEDARQVSVLGSRILTHVHNAERALDTPAHQEAKRELELAERLTDIVREMLPVTRVTTTVTDEQGRQVYRYQDAIQDDEIPIVEGLINVEVVQPIVEAKQERARVQGFQLTDANLVRTAVLLDLDYAERKIDRALTHLQADDFGQAQEALRQASAIGVRFVSNEQDSPLVEAQSALRLAERQVRNERYQGAKANLQLAQISLETYRTLVEEAADDKVREMLDTLETLERDIEAPDAAERIRDSWNQLATWFAAEPGMVRATVGSG